MEATGNDNGGFRPNSDHRIRLSNFRKKTQHRFMFESTGFESLDLNDITVDFVLVSAVSNVEGAERDVVDGWNPRHVFEEEIKKVGLLLEEDVVGELTFVKLHAPIKVMRKYCGIMKLRMPIKESIVNDSEAFDDKKENLDNGFGCCKSSLTSDYESKILTAEYSSEKRYLFDDDDPDFFSAEVRTLVIEFILNTTNWGKGKGDVKTVGFQGLIDRGVYEAAYLLHDGNCDAEGSLRRELIVGWASIDKFLRRQPIDQIKEYLGVAHAFYFAWLGFYTCMLIPVAVLSLIVFFYGIITLPGNRLSSDICHATDVIMCPMCDKCDYWQLSTACSYGQLSYLFDNDSTVIFAFIMSIWATLFLEMWKRYASTITYHWGLTDFNLDAEHPRPQYLSKLSGSKHTRKNVVTGEVEPFVPLGRQIPRMLISYSILLFFLILVVVAVLAVVVYRMVIESVISLADDKKNLMSKNIFIAFTAGIINLVCIQLLNYIYEKVAMYLTEIELPRTQTEFDELLKVKIYVFKFVNNYTSIIYIAFWKGKWIGYPGNYLHIFNLRQEACSPGGCLIELSIQLFIIMVGQQALNAFVEMIIPALKKRFNSQSENWKRKSLSDTDSLNLTTTNMKPWSEDYKLSDIGPTGLLPEYLEMVLQYGFVTLFVSAFPLSAFFALLNNVFELRLDAMKFLKFYRRPIPHRVPDIGVWYRILDIIGIISVTTNAVIIAFNSNFIPRFVYMNYRNTNHTDEGFLDFSLAYFSTKDFQPGTAPSSSSFNNVTECRYQDYRKGESGHYGRTSFYYELLIARLMFVVLYQNVVLLIKIIIQWMIPDVPNSLKDKIKRESYLTTRVIMEREAQKENDCKSLKKKIK